MTCIVGYIDNGIAYIASDGQITAGYNITTNNYNKIYINKDIIAAFSGTLVPLPALEKVFMNIETEKIIDLKLDIYDGFIAPAKKEIIHREINLKEYSFKILLAKKDQLIEVTEHWCITSYKEKTAIGSGGNYALGALEALSKIKMPILEKIKISMEVANSCDAGTNNNFVYADTQCLKLNNL
jgi:ATP-dependent protease HslVU (ClpYQ) peptidase subunit